MSGATLWDTVCDWNLNFLIYLFISLWNQYSAKLTIFLFKSSFRR